jgi:hypothetical protein
LDETNLRDCISGVIREIMSLRRVSSKKREYHENSDSDDEA